MDLPYKVFELEATITFPRAGLLISVFGHVKLIIRWIFLAKHRICPIKAVLPLLLNTEEIS